MNSVILSLNPIQNPLQKSPLLYFSIDIVDHSHLIY
jgi:hypothetical protein